jgi:hypothetical protein
MKGLPLGQMPRIEVQQRHERAVQFLELRPVRKKPELPGFCRYNACGITSLADAENQIKCE